MPFITTSGSKQYIVSPGQKFVVDRLKTANLGDILEMPILLSFGEDKEKTKLEVKVLSHTKGQKIRVVKYRPKSNYHKQYGFRAFQTVLEVVGGKPTKEDTTKDSKKEKVASKPLAKKSETSAKKSSSTKVKTEKSEAKKSETPAKAPKAVTKSTKPKKEAK